MTTGHVLWAGSPRAKGHWTSEALPAAGAAAPCGLDIREVNRLLQTSKQDTLRVLGDLGLPVPHLNTLYNCLRRCVERDYRSTIAASCWAHATARGPVALVMYDLTTLHFEVTNEDRLRKVGMSKERRVDPQVTVGLLVTADGFPLEVALFEGYAEVGVMPRCVCCAL